jgi:NAD(P)-dependent dehydrogenase (short-subunit alcohol dehydrogenase family)
MTGILEGRIAVITGASRGIGAVIARAFAREGAHVVLVARTVGALEELDDKIRAAGGSASLVPMDLIDYPAMDRLGAALYERFGKIDILVANGGILGTLTPVHHYDPKLWEQVIATNLTANQRLIRSLDPLLRKSDAGRAIFVTDDVAHSDKPFWGAYAVSKAALEAMVRSYAAENRMSAIKANLLNPGATRTTLRSSAYPGEDQASVKPPEELVPLFLDLASPECKRNGDLVTA